MRWASCTTWLLVSTKPSGVKTKPEPFPPRRPWRTSMLTTAGLTRSAAAVTASEYGSSAGAAAPNRVTDMVVPQDPAAHRTVATLAAASAGRGDAGRRESGPVPCPDGGIGRRAGFRYQWWQHRGGSSPFLGRERCAPMRWHDEHDLSGQRKRRYSQRSPRDPFDHRCARAVEHPRAKANVGRRDKTAPFTKR